MYLLYLLQPVFGTTMAWLFLRERRSPAFWPLAALALCGATLIVFSFNAAAPGWSSWRPSTSWERSCFGRQAPYSAATR